jgi:hypothetical protein
VATLGGGAFLIAEGVDPFYLVSEQSLKADLDLGFGLMMMRRGAIIGSNLVLSCGLSIILILILKAFPKTMFYVLIGICFAV